jgi:hypothetical protein
MLRILKEAERVFGFSMNDASNLKPPREADVILGPKTDNFGLPEVNCNIPMPEVKPPRKESPMTAPARYGMNIVQAISLIEKRIDSHDTQIHALLNMDQDLMAKKYQARQDELYDLLVLIRQGKPDD